MKHTQYLLKMNKAMEYNTNIDEIVRTIGMFRQQLIQYRHAVQFVIT